jgi:lactoylglutathione lyase
MELGNFSLSLAVRDIGASRAFYEAFGFAVVAGDQSQKWLVLANGATKIGLFQDMFEANLMTFNPGWSASGETLEQFTDVRDLQRALRTRGIAFLAEADEMGDGPAHFLVADPDGNRIMVDQHVKHPDADEP